MVGHNVFLTKYCSIMLGTNTNSYYNSIITIMCLDNCVNIEKTCVMSQRMVSLLGKNIGYQG